MTKIYKFMIMVACLLLMPSASQATITNTDVSAMVNALKYVRALDRDKNNQVDISIIYNANDASSLEDAKYMQTVLSASKALKAGQIIVNIISFGDIEKSQKADVYFISTNMSQNYEQLSSLAKSKKILMLSNDVACVKNNCCAIVVNPSSSTPIYINDSILNASGFDVDSNFRYLAKRI